MSYHIKTTLCHDIIYGVCYRVYGHNIEAVNIATVSAVC